MAKARDFAPDRGAEPEANLSVLLRIRQRRAGAKEPPAVGVLSFNGLLALERLGFEILERQSPTSTRAWISSDITPEEFNALELPDGWFKNQPREGDVDGGRFFRSPDAMEDGEFLDEELFGFTWRHSATVIEAGIPLDDERLLLGSRVAKYHEVEYHGGRTVPVLVSPEGDAYVRIGRDANRRSDDPSIPNGWRLVDYKTHFGACPPFAKATDGRPECGGRLRLLATITQREVIERILAHLGLPTDPVVPEPARHEEELFA